MPTTTSARVQVDHPTRAAEKIAAWRTHYCNSAFRPAGTARVQLGHRQRLVVKLDGVATPFEPSTHAQGEIVVVFHTGWNDTLTTAYFDQAAGRFLQAVGVLTYLDRIKLTGVQSTGFIAKLIRDAKQAAAYQER